MYRKPEKALGQSRRSVLSVDSEKKMGEIRRGGQRYTPGYTVYTLKWVICSDAVMQDSSVILGECEPRTSQKEEPGEDNLQGGGAPG